MKRHFPTNVRPLRLLLVCGVASSLCGCGPEEDKELNAAEPQAKSEQEIREEDREKYRTMFGSIVVPTYRGFDEPQAPDPLLYVVTDKTGEIAAFRRPLREPNYGRWAYDEVDSGVTRAEQASAEHCSLVIAADKNLRRDQFLRLAKELAEKGGRGQVWIQVWGVHPYPLQIPFELGEEALLSRFEDCETLQNIVDQLCEARVRNASPKRAGVQRTELPNKSRLDNPPPRR